MFLLYAYVLHIAARKFSSLISDEDSLTLDPDHINLLINANLMA